MATFTPTRDDPRMAGPVVARYVVSISPGRLACRRRGQVEFHPVQQGAFSDRAGVGGPPAQGLPDALPTAADVGWRNGGKGDQFHAVDLDLHGSDAIPAPGLTFARRHSRNDTVTSPAHPGSARRRTDHPAPRHHGRSRRVPVSRADKAARVFAPRQMLVTQCGRGVAASGSTAAAAGRSWFSATAGFAGAFEGGLSPGLSGCPTLRL